MSVKFAAQLLMSLIKAGLTDRKSLDFLVQAFFENLS